MLYDQAFKLDYEVDLEMAEKWPVATRIIVISPCGYGDTNIVKVGSHWISDQEMTTADPLLDSNGVYKNKFTPRQLVKALSYEVGNIWILPPPACPFNPNKEWTWNDDYDGAPER